MGVGQQMLQPQFSVATVSEEVENLEHGSIYADNGSGSQTLSSGSFSKITQFMSNGLSSANVAVDKDNNQITLNQTGIWEIFVSGSYSGTGSTSWHVHAHVDGVNQVNIGWNRRLGTGGDVGAGSDRGSIQVNSTGVVIDVRAEPDGASKDIDFVMLKLYVLRISGL